MKYNELIIDTKVKVKEANKHLTNERLKTEINGAMENYEKALEFFNSGLDQRAESVIRNSKWEKAKEHLKKIEEIISEQERKQK